MVSETVMAEYREIIRRRLRRWGQHPQYEEIEGEVTLAVLERLARLPEAEREQAHELVSLRARDAVGDFLSSPRHEFRTRTRCGNAILPRLELDSLAPGERERLVGITPDFAPPLIEALWRRDLWERFFAGLPERERELVWLWLQGGHEALPERQRVRHTLRRRINLVRRSLGLSALPGYERMKEPLDALLLCLSPADEELRFAHEWFLRGGGQRAPLVYRSGVPKGTVSLMWDVIERRDGRRATSGETAENKSKNPFDLRRENLVRISHQEHCRHYEARMPAAARLAYRAARADRRRSRRQEAPAP